jgi:hypothetical protein
MTAPVIPTPTRTVPTRNKLGRIALVLVLITLALPIIGFIVFVIAAAIEGAEGDNLGYAILGAFFFIPVASAFIAPVAIVGVVLGIISLFRRGQRKLQGVLAIILGIVPALMITLLPVAIDNFIPRG